jgi:hypothetical protein
MHGEHGNRVVVTIFPQAPCSAERGAERCFGRTGVGAKPFDEPVEGMPGKDRAPVISLTDRRHE